MACFSYAHVPWIKPHQRQLDEGALPRGGASLRLFAGAAEEFGAAGYRIVGFDHFARPATSCARALDDGGLHRNFMGYTVMPASDQIGVGVTAIGDDRGRVRRQSEEPCPLPARGRRRPAPDRARSRQNRRRRASGDRHPRIICTLAVDFDAVRRDFGVDPEVHFADALAALAGMADDGLVVIDDHSLQVTPRGRFFLRNVCMPFDEYLTAAGEKPVYSRTV